MKTEFKSEFHAGRYLHRKGWLMIYGSRGIYWRREGDTTLYAKKRGNRIIPIPTAWHDD